MQKLKKYLQIPVFIIIAGTLFQGVAMWRTGLFYSYGLGFWGPLARDGIWHEALVGQLMRGLPPVNPGLSGNLLFNYHYFYDLVAAVTSQITLLTPRIVIYLLLPFLFSVFLGQGVYYLGKRIFKEAQIVNLTLFFLYFGSSFGWVLGILRGTEIGGESAFWANQPVSMNLNPPFALSLILVVVIMLTLDNYMSAPKKLSGAVVVILTGILVGVKIYAALVVLAGILSVAIYTKYKTKNNSGLILFSGTLGACLLVFMALSRGALGLIEFKPLWLLDTMIDAGDRVGIPDLTAKRFAYQSGGNWLGYFGVEAIALAIFLLGNLGTRIVGLVNFTKLPKNNLTIFIVCAALAGLVPPLLYIQKGNPWNIIQFFYYSLFFAGFLAAHAIWTMLKSKNNFQVTIAVIVLLLTPISSLATFRSWLYPNPPAYLSGEELTALTYLSQEPPGVVLKNPFNQALSASYTDPYPLAVYADNAYVSAFSNMSVYVEDVEQQIVLSTDFEPRLASARRFFVEKDLAWSNEFLVESIDYVYVPRIYQLPRAEEEYSMKKIFENSEVNIYKVVK